MPSIIEQAKGGLENPKRTVKEVVDEAKDLSSTGEKTTKEAFGNVEKTIKKGIKEVEKVEKKLSKAAVKTQKKVFWLYNIFLSFEKKGRKDIEEVF